MERLSGQDASFLAFETPSHPMHVGAVALFGPPGDGSTAHGWASGAADALVHRLGALPRFRQRLARGMRPAWIDDPDAEPTRHVHRVEVPDDLDSDAFRERLDQLFTRPLDTARSPWEAFVLHGMDGGSRFALLLKVHHCMIDGTAGLGVLAHLLDPQPRPTRPTAADGAEPSGALRRPPPGRARGVRPLLTLARRLLERGSDTPLHGAATARRRIERLVLDEAALREHAREAGGTTNDALLAVVSGGVRRWLGAGGLDPDEVRLRAFCPVDVRRAGEEPHMGNRLGAWLVDLPIVGDDAQRMGATVRATGRTRDGGHAAGVDLLARISDFLPAFVPRWTMALAGRLRTFSLVVTHVRGPSRPVRFLGAPLEEIHALAPVFQGQRCSIAAFRYAGRIHLGITGAWPDPSETRRLAAAIQESYDACTGDPSNETALWRQAI